MSWRSIAALIGTEAEADGGILGAPRQGGSVTPGRFHLAPGVSRQTLRLFSPYNIETGDEITRPVPDAGAVSVQGTMPADAYNPLVEAIGRCTSAHALTLLLGGNNAVTRPAAHSLGVPLEQVGLI